MTYGNLTDRINSKFKDKQRWKGGKIENTLKEF
jgi:hypothetical protein